jgi:hypothetical protein
MAAGSKAARADPQGAHSNSPGLAEPVRFYVRGLQPRPSVQLSSPGMSLTMMNIPAKNPEPRLVWCLRSSLHNLIVIPDKLAIAS